LLEGIKSTNRTQKIYLKKSKFVSTNAEFYAEVKTIGKKEK